MTGKPRMLIDDPFGELNVAVEEIETIEHPESITGLLGAVFHKTASLSRSTELTSEQRAGLRDLAFDLRLLVEKHEGSLLARIDGGMDAD